jgi:hypothetical protein
LQEERHHYNKIRQTLKKRGLRMNIEDDWEIHGPHPDMNYVVYVGYAYYDKWQPPQFVPKENRLEGVWVAIYPRAVYEIEEESKWNETGPEQKILIFDGKNA